MGRLVAFVTREIREAIPPAVFFLFLFHLIALTRAVTLDDFSITALRVATATLSALIVAKAILVVDALPISNRFYDRRAIHVLWKTFLYGVLVLVIKLLEEVIHLLDKQSGAENLFEVIWGQINWPLFTVLSLWTGGGLLLYCLAAEFYSEAVHEQVKRLFFSARKGEST